MEKHEHIDENGKVITHTHSHAKTKAVLNRLSRASGHLDSVKRMIEDGKDCSEVLIQLSAVIAALNSTSKVILKDHMEHCLVDALKTGDSQALDDLTDAIDHLIK
ncbi:MAG: metal-sensing transcriptional repressor [Erysipelotrichaceae bacterium]